MQYSSTFGTFLLAYYKLTAGKVCENVSNVIRSQGECTHALRNLGFPSTRSYWIVSRSSIPAGCSIRRGGLCTTCELHAPHINSIAGVGKGRRDLIPICKKPQTPGKFFPLEYKSEMCVMV